MSPAITLDMRGYDVETPHQLEHLVNELVPKARTDFPGCHIHAVVISWRQQKRIRLYQYEHGMPLQVVKENVVVSVCNLPVTILDEDEPLRCPNCGDIHGDNQAWYPSE